MVSPKTTLTMSSSSKGTQAQSRTPGLTEGQMSTQTMHSSSPKSNYLSGAEATPSAPPPVSKQPLFTLKKAEQHIKLLLHMLSVQHLPPVTISSDGNSLSMRSLKLQSQLLHPLNAHTNLGSLPPPCSLLSRNADSGRHASKHMPLLLARQLTSVSAMLVCSHRQTPP